MFVLKIVVKGNFLSWTKTYASGLRVQNAVSKVKVVRLSETTWIKAMFACKQLERQEAYVEIVNSGGLLSNLFSKKGLI